VIDFKKLPFTPENIAALNLPKQMNVYDFNRWQIVNYEVVGKEAIGMNCEAAKNERWGIIARYVNTGRHV